MNPLSEEVRLAASWRRRGGLSVAAAVQFERLGYFASTGTGA